MQPVDRVLTVVIVLGVLVVLFIAAVVATRNDPLLADAPMDLPDLELPPGPLQPEDVRRVRFSLALRGYRMREVDHVLARIAVELAARDERLLALEQALVEVVEPHVEEAERRLVPPPEPVAAEPVPELLTEPQPELLAPPPAPAVPSPSSFSLPAAEPPALPVPAATDPLDPLWELVPQPGGTDDVPDVTQPPAQQPDPAVRWPQPDLEPEPESLPAVVQQEQPQQPEEPPHASEEPPQPSGEQLPQEPPVSGFSDLYDDGFPQVQRAEDDPSPESR